MKPKIISCLILVLVIFVFTTAKAQEELTTDTEVNSPNLLYQPTYTFYNLLKNGSFESWSGTAVDEWIGNGVISKNSDKYLGSYSVGLSNPAILTQSYSEINHLLDKKVIFGCWVKASSANQTRISIDDGQTQSFSSYHSGSDDVWEFLTVTKKVSPQATQLTIAVYNELNDTANIDGACLYEVTTKGIVFTPHSFDDLKILSKIIYTDLENKNVGIGDIPDSNYKLDIFGSLNAQGYFLDNSALGMWKKSDDSNIYFEGGKVGIGTVPANELLEVGGNIKANAFLGDGANLENLPILWQKKDDGSIYYDGGNVGVGTDSPSQKLDVDGDIKVGGGEIYGINGIQGLGSITTGWYSDDSNLAARIPSNTGYFGVQDSGGNNTFLTVGKENTYINGKVGIGVSNPNHPFQVNVGGISYFEVHSDSQEIATGSSGGQLRTGTIYDNGGNLTLDTQASDRDLYLKANGQLGALVDGVSGNVGIGTNSPEYKLHIYSPDSVARIAVETDKEDTAADVKLFNSDGKFISLGIRGPQAGNYYDLVAGDSYIIADSTETNLKILSTGKLSLGSAMYTDLTIDENGNVGIGTTEASEKLQVAGNIKLPGAPKIVLDTTVGGVLNLETANGVNAALSINDYGGGAYGGITIIKSGTAVVNIAGGGLSGPSFFNAGNVGIGITNPNYKLDVSGIVNADDFYKNGSAFNPSQWNNSSSGSKIYYAGNVGIGTDDPTYQLTIRDTGSSSRLSVGENDDTQGDIGWDITNKLLFLSTASYNYPIRIGNNWMYFKTDGNVGIGTAAPGDKLTIAGAARTGTAANLRLYDTDDYQDNQENTGRLISSIDFRMDDGDWTGNSAAKISTVSETTWAHSVGLAFYTGNPISEVMRISGGNGNVGIGAVNGLSDRLVVSDASYDTTVAIDNDASEGRRWQLISHGSGTTIGPVGGFGIRDGDIGGNDRLVIDANGNVGIGTTDPQNKLHIANGNLMIEDSNLAEISFTGDYAANIYQGGNLPLYINTAKEAIYLGTGGSGATHLNIVNGNVGIGTTAPIAKLDVQGSAPSIRLKSTDATSVNLTLDGNTSSGDNTQIQFNRGGSAKAFIGTRYSSDPSDGLFFYVNGSDRMVIQSNGNVGIGISNPTYKLHVNGSIQIDNGNINAKYQDVAEWVESEEELTPATVVIIAPNSVNKVIASNSAYDSKVCGVVSYQPGLSLGEKGENKYQIAHTGRVKVKADASFGRISQGDLLVTSPRQGYAMKYNAKDYKPGVILGKALEAFESGEGEILVLLSLQ